MPPKKKATVAKKRPSHGGKPKVSKANKTKTKATKRKTQMKKRKDKRTQKQRKQRKKTEKAKRTAKKKKTKKSKKKKDKKKKKAAKKAAPKAKPDQKQQPPSEEGDDDDVEDGEEALGMKLAGMTLNQMQNLRKSVAELTKDEFLEQLKNHGENRSEEVAFQAAYMTSAENRTKLFYDLEQPTDSSSGPFQSNRFGAVFLIPGQR